jgi:hypothetical protein
VKGICKNSATLSKYQTLESWALKEKRCKPKGYVIYYKIAADFSMEMK